MQKNWYEHFFRGLALDTWRRAVTPEQTLAEVDFIETELRVPPNGTLLDNPCGNGRHSLELAARGYRVTGIDLSDEFLGEAKASAKARRLEVEYKRQDMREIDVTAEFDGAFCFGNSFGYVDYGESCAFLAAVSRSLKPGGRFVLESGIMAESLLPNRQPQRWMRLGDILFLSSNRYHPAESRLDIEYKFVQDGRMESREASSYIFTVAEIGRMLAQSGLRAVAHYSSIERQAYELGSPRLLLVAQKE